MSSTKEPQNENESPEIPQLTTYTATSQEDQIAALRLVADSIAQQRQVAANAIITHPLTLALMTIPLAVVYQIIYKDRSDWPLIGTTWAGCIMAGLLLVRFVTSGYIEIAEERGTWRWLNSLSTTTTATTSTGSDITESKTEDVVLVTKFGDQIIGVLVLRDSSECTLIRGWTVKLRYRRKGVGRGLLETAIARDCSTRGKEQKEIRFDEEHAHSGRVLWGMFNGVFEKRERWAREVLRDVLKNENKNSK